MKWRTAKDSWDSRMAGHGIFRSDKFTHCILFTFLTFLTVSIFDILYLPENFYFSVSIVLFLLGILWEIKDAFYKWETAKIIRIGMWDINLGGDGFSWRDIIANSVGIILGLGFYIILNIILNI